MVLEFAKTGTTEGKPLVEGYGLGELGASGALAGGELEGLAGLAAGAEAVLPGAGPLVAGVVRLAAGACREVTLDGMESLVLERGRELLCGVVQLGLDAQAAAEVRVPGVTGADGVRRTRAEPGHARRVVTRLGVVVVRRIGYRSGVKGAGLLFPRDAVLNLPPARYSWLLQRLAVMFAREGSYEQAGEFLAAADGVRVGKRQVEQMVKATAADAAAFCDAAAPAAPGGEAGRQEDGPGGDGPGGAAGLPLGLSPDGKGVSMLPESRRARARAPGERVKNFSTRPGTGEKTGHKRIAETACVFDVIPRPRTPEEVMASCHGGSGTENEKQAENEKKEETEEEQQTREPGPRAVNRRYRSDIAGHRSASITWMFDEGERRDPAHRRTWIFLTDGDNHQIARIEQEAARRGITVTILIDLIHVLEYLWKAAWAFHQPRDPAIEAWTIARATDILHGRAAEVADRIARLARQHPPDGAEHAKNIKKALSYLRNKQPYLDYPTALANGWPVATGVIEGACRHLVGDRMGITGARWSTPGAQAILSLRAIHASGHDDAYWRYHLQQEHHRNHHSRYQHDLTLAA